MYPQNIFLAILLLTTTTAHSAIILLPSTPPAGYNDDFIDPMSSIQTFSSPITSLPTTPTPQTPLDFCLSSENSVPLEEVQAGQKYLADLGTTLCVVKALDRYFYRSRVTGRAQGRIMATNYHPKGEDVASYCSDLAIAVQFLIDHCTREYEGRMVVGGYHDTEGNVYLSVSIGEYAVDPADD